MYYYCYVTATLSMYSTRPKTYHLKNIAIARIGVQSTTEHGFLPKFTSQKLPIAGPPTLTVSQILVMARPESQLRPGTRRLLRTP